MPGESIFDLVNAEAVIVFVGAHPDDETTIGPLLAYCAERCREVVVVSLTRGHSGWNLGREDLTRTLAEVRESEQKAAMKVLGCTPLTYDYVNGTSTAHPEGLAVFEPAEAAIARWKANRARECSPEHHYSRWTQEAGDPAKRLLCLFKRKHATAVIAFEAGHGFTHHPEHLTATMAVQRAVASYRAETGQDLPLFYAYPPQEQVEGAETIATAELNRLGGKDYADIAWKSWACYESQYGPAGKKLDSFMRGCIEACKLKRAQLE